MQSSIWQHRFTNGFFCFYIVHCFDFSHQRKRKELGLSSFYITIISVLSSIFGCGCCVCCCYFLCKENEDETNVDHRVTNVNIPLRNVSSSTLTQQSQASGNVSNGNSDLAVTESTPMFNPDFSGKTTHNSIKHLIVNIDWIRLNFKKITITIIEPFLYTFVTSFKIKTTVLNLYNMFQLYQQPSSGKWNFF